VVAKKLAEKLAAMGFDVQIDQCKASEVGARATRYDLIVSTTEVDDAKGRPIVRTLSFLTGVGIEADVQKIAGILREK
jgi:PTS system galactitol-specific IIB component